MFHPFVEYHISSVRSIHLHSHTYGSNHVKNLHDHQLHLQLQDFWLSKEIASNSAVMQHQDVNAAKSAIWRKDIKAVFMLREWRASTGHMHFCGHELCFSQADSYIFLFFAPPVVVNFHILMVHGLIFFPNWVLIFV